jgi:hypothetical protein
MLIREMRLSDIPAGLALCRASRWNQTERDWQYFLTAAPHGALVAVEDGTVVGTVATLPYGSFTWVSMVLVDPMSRGRGIGTCLLDRGLALIPTGVVPRLDATPAGEVLYRKLGFVGEYGLSRLYLDSARREAPAGTAARQLRRADWPMIHEIDCRAFGASRAGLLERLADEAPEYAWLAERRGHVHGYVFGRHGHVRDQIGPLVAEDTETAGVLLDACLLARPDIRLFIDAPVDRSAWRAELDRRGFVVERTFLRMHRGILAAAGERSRIHAIIGPEFG